MTSVTSETVDPAFEGLVRERLDAIEGQLQEAARAQTAFTTDAAQHLLSAGGKRFRPALVVTAANSDEATMPKRVSLPSILPPG